MTVRTPDLSIVRSAPPDAAHVVDLPAPIEAAPHLVRLAPLSDSSATISEDALDGEILVDHRNAAEPDDEHEGRDRRSPARPEA